MLDMLFEENSKLMKSFLNWAQEFQQDSVQLQESSDTVKKIY